MFSVIVMGRLMCGIIMPIKIDESTEYQNFVMVNAVVKGQVHVRHHHAYHEDSRTTQYHNVVILSCVVANNSMCGML